jgi:hypothetical protein
MRGRHPSGSDLVDEITGSGLARRRLKVMLETISGQKKIAEACEELGIGEAQFHKLRHKMLAGALATLEPSAAGRPPMVRAENDERIAGIQEEIQQLRIELRAAQIREEVALLMPHLVKVPDEGGKKTASRPRLRGGSGGTQDKSGGSAN